MSADPSDQPFKLSLGSSKPNSLTPAKRTRAALTEESDHEDDQTAQEDISGFENGTSIINAESSTGISIGRKEPLVIPVQKDAEWRNPANLRKRGTNLLPPEARSLRERDVKNDETAEEVGKQQYGLIVSEYAVVKNGSSGGRERDGGASDNSEQAPSMSLDEQAYARLISSEERKSNLIIPDAGSGGAGGGGWIDRSEPDGFKADVASRPDSSTVTDYETVPIEEFGAAMLRGMGWKDGEGIGRGVNAKKPVNPRVLERRPNLLGIGAKNAPEGLEEFGAWGKGAKDNTKVPKGPKTRAVYNPLVMRNSATGEVATEDEVLDRQTERSTQQATTEERESRKRQKYDGGNQREAALSRDRERDRDRHRYRDKQRSSRTDRLRNDDGERREREDNPSGRDRTSRRAGDRDRHKRDRSQSISPARGARERYHDDGSRQRRKENAHRRAGSRSRSPRRSRSRDRHRHGRQRYYDDQDTGRSYKRRSRE